MPAHPGCRNTIPGAECIAIFPSDIHARATDYMGTSPAAFEESHTEGISVMIAIKIGSRVLSLTLLTILAKILTLL